MIMSSIDVLLEEYKILSEVGEKYFDRLYQTLYFAIIFYGAILAFMQSNTTLELWYIMFCYFLPIGTYLFGLFYAYNSYVITRQGFCMIELEMRIREEFLYDNGKSGFTGWNIISKKYGGGYILAYGTSLIFFVIAPIFDYCFGIVKCQFKIINAFTQYKIFNYLYGIFPIIFYITYIIFMIIIISNIVHMYKMIQCKMK